MNAIPTFIMRCGVYNALIIMYTKRNRGVSMSMDYNELKQQRMEQVKKWIVMASADGSKPNPFSMHLLKHYYIEGKLSLEEIDDIVMAAVKEFR